MVIAVCGNHTVKDYFEFCMDDEIPESFTLTFMTDVEIDDEHRCELCGKPALLWFKVDYSHARRYTTAQLKQMIDTKRKEGD